MMKINTVKNLKCWQAAQRLVKTVYTISEFEQFSDRYFLKGQFKRSAILALSNMAEGFDTRSNQECINYLNSSQRSVAELKCMSKLFEDHYCISSKNIDSVIRQITDDLRARTEDVISFLLSNNN